LGVPLRPRVLATLALAQVFILGSGSTAALAPNEAAALGASAVLTLVSGDVVVGHPGHELVAAAAGEVIAAGDTIRTGPEATAEITYFEGSSVRIEAGTELVIEALATETDGGTVIAMAQAIGRTWHVVTKLLTPSSRYEVRTPASAASVRGTIFAVEVRNEDDGPAATVVTLEGAVVHSAPDPARPGATVAVRVAAGQESTSTRGKPAGPAHPAAPARLSGAPQRPAATARPSQRADASGQAAPDEGAEGEARRGRAPSAAQHEAARARQVVSVPEAAREQVEVAKLRFTGPRRSMAAMV